MLRHLTLLRFVMAGATALSVASCSQKVATHNETSGVASAADNSNATPATAPSGTASGSLSLDEATAPSNVTQLQVLLLTSSTCLASSTTTTASGITVTISNASGSATATTPTTALPAGITAACVVSNTTSAYAAGQTVTLNNIPVGTYALLVVWEDATGADVEQGEDASVTIAAGQNAVASIVMGAPTTATTTGSGSTGSLTIDFVQAATKLAFAGAAPSEAPSGCAALDIQLQDASSNASPLAAAITLNLTTTATTTGSFFADSACATTAITALTIAAGATDGTAYYKDSTIGTPTLTVTDPTTGGLGTATTTATIAAVVLPASKLAWTGTALSEAVNTCGPVEIETQDSTGTPAVIGATALPLTVATTSASGTFYADAACATVIPSTFNLAASSDIATIYYKDASAGTPTLTVTDPSTGGLGSATTTATITATGN